MKESIEPWGKLD